VITGWLREAVERHTQAQVERSHCLQSKEERRARLNTIIALSVELDRIRSVDHFATALGAAAIEDVIEGDWEGLSSFSNYFTFEGESEELRARYAPLWKAFYLVLVSACTAARQRAVNPGEAPS
jgi:hypothetical protein